MLKKHDGKKVSRFFAQFCSAATSGFASVDENLVFFSLPHFVGIRWCSRRHRLRCRGKKNGNRSNISSIHPLPSFPDIHWPTERCTRHIYHLPLSPLATAVAVARKRCAFVPVLFIFISLPPLSCITPIFSFVSCVDACARSLFFSFSLSLTLSALLLLLCSVHIVLFFY